MKYQIYIQICCMRCLSIFAYNSMGRCTLCMYMADTWIKFLRTPETYLFTCWTTLPRCTRRTEKLSTNDASSARCAAAGCNNNNWQRMSLFQIQEKYCFLNCSSTATSWQRKGCTSTRVTTSAIAATSSFMTHGYCTSIKCLSWLRPGAICRKNWKVH